MNPFVPMRFPSVLVLTVLLSSALHGADESSAHPIPVTDYRPQVIEIADDAALIASLDLERPELATVRAAAVAGDVEAAVAAFAAHLRGRERPVIMYEGERVAPIEGVTRSERRLGPNAAAEKIVAGDFTIANIRHVFEGGRIDWRLNPTTQPGYKGPWSNQFQTQLSRMHIWPQLVAAWKETGNPFYLGAWSAQLADWRSKNPPPSVDTLPAHIAAYRQGPNSREFPLYQPLDSGQRATQTSRVLEMVRRSSEVSDRTLVESVKFLAEHARLITQMPIGDNHLAIATGGLAAAAASLPEFKESAAWMQEALARVSQEVNRQFYPDGAQTELSPWYHFTALRQFANVLELATANGIQVDPAVLGRMERAFDHLFRTTDPDGFVPPLNDGEYLAAAGFLKRGLDFFPRRADWSWVLSGGKEGAAPSFTSVVAPWAGQGILRSGWSRGDLYLLMECGPFGTGHMHEDKLSPIVNAYGRRILVDTGRSPYEASVRRDYMIGGSAHSTVLVDGRSQARRLSKASGRKVEQPEPFSHSLGGEVEHLCGTFGELPHEVFALPVNAPGAVAPQLDALVIDDALRGAREQSTLRAVHRRHVFFVRPVYWVIVDELTPGEGASEETAYTTLFHFGPGETTVEGTQIVLGEMGNAGAVLAAAPGTADSLQVLRGQEEPFWMGWQFKDGKPSPIPTALFRRTSRGPTLNAYVLIPHRAGEQPARPVLSWIGEGGARGLHVHAGGVHPDVTLFVGGAGAEALLGGRRIVFGR